MQASSFYFIAQLMDRYQLSFEIKQSGWCLPGQKAGMWSTLNRTEVLRQKSNEREPIRAKQGFKLAL